MNCSVLYRFFLFYVLSVYYSVQLLFVIALSYVKCLFMSTASRKLEPPACLSDPKYGVHKFVKNIKLHYVESGVPSKPLMLFLHGFPEFWYSWRHQILEFQKDYWCIAMDMRGYGDSEKPQGVAPYKLDELAADVRDLIKQLGRKKCIIISHDWGGMTAAKLREGHPEMLSACILLSSMSVEAYIKAVFADPTQRKKSW